MKRNPQQQPVHSVTLTVWLGAAKRRSIEIGERGSIVLIEKGRRAAYRTVNAAAAALFVDDVVWERVVDAPRARAVSAAPAAKAKAGA